MHVTIAHQCVQIHFSSSTDSIYYVNTGCNDSYTGMHAYCIYQGLLWISCLARFYGAQQQIFLDYWKVLVLLMIRLPNIWTLLSICPNRSNFSSKRKWLIYSFEQVQINCFGKQQPPLFCTSSHMKYSWGQLLRSLLHHANQHSNWVQLMHDGNVPVPPTPLLFMHYLYKFIFVHWLTSLTLPCPLSVATFFHHE